MTEDFDNAVRAVHQANIGRYRRLLATSLTDNEREFIERRLLEEEDKLLKAGLLDLAMD